MATEHKVDKPVLKKDGAKPTHKKSRKGPSFAAAGRFFRDVVSELKKVSWPSRKEFVSYTMAVVIFVAIAGIVIFAMDSIIGTGVTRLLNMIGS